MTGDDAASGTAAGGGAEDGGAGAAPAVEAATDGAATEETAPGAAASWRARARRLAGSWPMWVGGIALSALAWSALNWAALKPAAPPASHLQAVRGPDFSVLNDTTPSVRERIASYDREREKTQTEAGESYVPTATGPLHGDAPAPARKREDARAIAAKARTELDDSVRETAAAVAPAPETVAPGAPLSLDDPLLKRIETLFAAWRDRGARAPVYRTIDYGAGTPARGGRVSAAPKPQARAKKAAPAPIPAGTVAYASLRFSWDSDLPDAPAISTIHGGALDGATLIGRAQPVRGRAAIRYDRLVTNGVSRKIEAWAVGEDCDCLALDGDYDPRLLSTVFLPAAMDFLTGFGLPELAARIEVAAGDGTTVVESEGGSGRDRLLSGASNAARGIYDRFSEVLPTGGHTRIFRGVPHAVVFVGEGRR